MPDPYVVIEVNGTVVARSPRVDDTFTASWTNAVFRDVVIPAGSTVAVHVFDYDAWSDSDLAFSCRFAPLSAATIRSRTLSCSGPPGSAEVSIYPQ
jgi:hypothetical protein